MSMDSITNFIVAAALLIGSATSAASFFAAKFHIERRIKNGALVVQDLNAAAAASKTVVDNAQKIDAVVQASKALEPEVAKVLDAHEAQIEAATKALDEKSAAIDEVRSVLSK